MTEDKKTGGTSGQDAVPDMPENNDIKKDPADAEKKKRRSATRSRQAFDSLIDIRPEDDGDEDDGEEFVASDEDDEDLPAGGHTERTGTTPTFVTGVLKSVIYLASVIVVSVFLAIGIIFVGNDIFALVKDDSIIEVEIHESITVDELTDLLYENKIINVPLAFKLYAAMKDVDTSKFVPGKYNLSPMMNYEMLCSVFLPVEERKIVRLTIPEGSSVNDIIRIFTEAGIGTREGFVDAINNFDYTEYFPFLVDVYASCTPDRAYKLEGYLYPDTYDFYSDSKETQIIYKLLENFDAKFSDEMKRDASDAGFTIDEIMILASIVQKESFYSEDFDLVASVFVNRLADPTNYPMLESDATTAYAIELATGSRPDDITADEVDFDHPYNTRVKEGLPPGAICNPGYDAIMCTIYPAKTSYYYFVADNEGRNQYSSTYAEHKAKVDKIKAEAEENAGG